MFRLMQLAKNMTSQSKIINWLGRIYIYQRDKMTDSKIPD